MSKIIEHILTSKDGGVLHTRNKYCDKDIKITPRLADATITENGDYPVPDGYSGHGNIIVNIPVKEEVDLEITRNGTYTAREGVVYKSITVNVPNIYHGRQDLSVGASFSYSYSGSSPTVECPDCFTYSDSGSVLVFTAISDGSGEIYIWNSDDLLAKYEVTAKYDYDLKIGEAFSKDFGDTTMRLISSPECVSYATDSALGRRWTFTAISSGSGLITLTDSAFGNIPTVTISVRVAYDYELKVGESFVFDYAPEDSPNDTRPIVTCSSNIAYSDDGDVITFTAISTGVGVITLQYKSEDEDIVTKYYVNVTE